MKNGKIKILIFADANSIHTLRWVQGLKLDEVFELHLLSMNPAGIREDIVNNGSLSSIKVIAPEKINVDGGNFNYLLQIIKIVFYIIKLKPEIINAHYLTSYGFIASIIKFRSKLLLSLHGTDIMVTPNRSILYRTALKFTLKKADHIFAVSQTMHSELIKMDNDATCKTTVIQYGIPKSVFLKENLEKENTFICNRTWVENSNLLMLIDAFKLLGVNYKLVLIGKVDSELGIGICTHADGAENITLFPPMDYESNIDIIAKCKFFISYTTSDGTSLSLIEAMALKCIPIISDILPNREWITSDYNGLLVKLHDIDDLCMKIMQASSMNDHDVNRIQLINYNLVYKKFIFENNFAAINTIIKRQYYGTGDLGNYSGTE